MWTEKEISRCAKTFVDNESTLEEFCDSEDIGKLRKNNKFHMLTLCF